MQRIKTFVGIPFGTIRATISFIQLVHSLTALLPRKTCKKSPVGLVQPRKTWESHRKLNSFDLVLRHTEHQPNLDETTRDYINQLQLKKFIKNSSPFLGEYLILIRNLHLSLFSCLCTPFCQKKMNSLCRKKMSSHMFVSCAHHEQGWQTNVVSE